MNLSYDRRTQTKYIILKILIKLIENLKLQAHQCYAMALSKLGDIEDAITSYCISLVLTKDPANVPNTVRLEIAKVHLISHLFFV